MLALLLGAGFSKWAADLPVASQLFDFDIESWGLREYKKLEIVKSLKHNWDISHLHGLTEQFIADAMNFQEKNKQAVLWYIVRRLSELFIWKEYHVRKWHRHVLMIDENRRFNVPGIVKAQSFFQRFYTPLLGGIITTNYDMVVEYALGTKRFNYGIPNEMLTGRGPYPLSQWKNPVTLKGRIPLAKIHGSISWDEQIHYTNGRRGLTGHALIVAPTPEKQSPDSLKSVWNLAKEILRKATRIIVFGFAFNPYDEAVLNLLQSEGKNLESVLLVNIESKTEAARSLWPSTKIISVMPPPDGNKEIQNWQQILNK
jgi:hypothetical protein